LFKIKFSIEYMLYNSHEVSMERFKNYLLAKQIVPKNKISCYTAWVSQCYASCDKDPGDELSSAEVERFLKQLSKSCKEWKLRQAEGGDLGWI
jgi:hypothetical protein